MSEMASQQPDSESAARLQQALEIVLGTFAGSASEHLRNVDPANAAGVGHAMLSGAAQSAAAESSRPVRTIEEDIAMGTSPWLAHIRHNQQDADHPLLTGFYQDETGKVRPLYGNGLFESRRQIEPGFMQFHTNERRVAMLAGTFVPVQSPEVIRGEHWDALPDDLRQHFEQGEILMTTGNDVYAHAATAPTAEDLALHEETYFLMYYYDVYGGGRTGVVMHVVDGELQPVTATLDDREYILEVKGCGTRFGGFGELHNRTEREIVTGGAEADQTMIELERLADEQQPGAPKAVGGILFENPDLNVYGHPEGRYPQGYTIRLSPSTVRASYSGNPDKHTTAYPDIQTPEMVERVLDMYTAQFTDHMFGNPPKILNRSSHTENILLWGNGEYTFTDYSDHATFADSHYPSERVNPKEMLLAYLEMFTEIPGARQRNRPEFYARLNEQFAAHGVDIALLPEDTLEQATQKIWERGMAYQVYKARVGSGYAPDGMFKDHFEFFDSKTMMRSVDRSSAEAMTKSIVTAREEMAEAIDMIAMQGVSTPSQPDHENLTERIRTGTFSELADIADQLYADYRAGSEHIPYEAGRDIREALAFFSAFRRLTVNTAQEYFEHELDVLDNALKGCPAEEREAIAAVRAEVIEKREYLLSLPDTDVRTLYGIVKDADSLRAFLQPSAYKAA
jgi:hypothetical protein